MVSPSFSACFTAHSFALTTPSAVSFAACPPLKRQVFGCRRAAFAGVLGGLLSSLRALLGGLAALLSALLGCLLASLL